MSLVATVRHGRRSFGHRAVLTDVNLELRAGEFVAIVGRSGSGKSTLLRILAGLDRGAAGEVLVTERRMMVFQDARLLPWLSVLDNVVLGLPSGESTAGRDALGEVGLSGHERAWPKTLSGGEAQRVALARALVRRPQLLLLDEPFGSLDAITRLQMHDLLRRLHAAHRPGTLLVTHDIDEALALADRVLVLANGVFTTAITVNGDATVSDGKSAEGPTALARQRLFDALGLQSPGATSHRRAALRD